MKREQWKSRLGFMWAAVGSAIGLGSIWRFPYVVGSYGGASFIFLYLICLFLVGLPVLISEITIGRKTALSPYGAFKSLSGSRVWGSFGKITILTGFLVSTFYGVIAGLTLGYLGKALIGTLLTLHTSSDASLFFSKLSSSPFFMLTSLSVFMAASCFILYFGVQKGIEAGNKIMMPLLIVVLFALAIKGMAMPGGEKALTFLLKPDFSKITPAAVIVALGQAFFSLSLGQGTMVTYGSYLRRDENVPTTALPIALFGICVSMLAGIAIFTIVFSYNLSPSSGESLMFQTLPVVFSDMPGGYLFSLAFFTLLVLAGLTSQISALEPSISYLSDQWKIGRKKAVCVVCASSFAIGVPCALSFGLLEGSTIFGMTLFSFIEFTCVNILIPLGGFVAVVLLGWKWGMGKALHEIKIGATGTFERYRILSPYLRFSIKYGAPLLILFIFLDSLGLFR